MKSEPAIPPDQASLSELVKRFHVFWKVYPEAKNAAEITGSSRRQWTAGVIGDYEPSWGEHPMAANAFYMTTINHG